MKKDWEARRAHYAACLDIDIDYLDTEAVDGTIFPSSSGLFAYPANPEDNECCVLEFLNFWMPHLLDCPFGQDLSPRKYKGEYRPKDVSGEFSNREELIYLRHVEYVCKKLQRIQNVPWIKPYRQFFLTMWDSFLVWEFVDKEIVSHKLKWTLSNIIPELDTLEKIDIQKETDESKFVEKISAFFGKSKGIFCEYLKGYYKGLQPTQFWLEPAREAGEGPQPVQDDRTPRIWETKNDNALYDDRYNSGDEEIYVNLWHQFPNFINTCDEYIVKDACIHKSNGLEFYEKIKKVYFLLDIPTSSQLLKYFRAFEAMLISAPAASDITVLEEYYDNCYLKYHALPNPFSENMEKENSWWSTVRDIIRRREQEFEEALLQYAQSVANEDLNPANKQEILFAIKERFSKCSGIFSLELSKIEDKIEGVRQDYDFKMSALVSRIEYIRQRDKFEREQEKAKEAETRVAERDDVITTICHNINPTIGSIKSNLDFNEKLVSNDIRSSLKRALFGAEMIGNMVDQILRSYKYTKEQFFDDIDNPDDSSYRFEDMLYENLDVVVENTFSDDFLYEQEYLFSDKTEMQRLKEEFYNSPQDDILNFINKNFTNIKIMIPENILNKRIGDKNGTATNIYILFNEFIKNAFRALAYVPSDKRAFSIEAYDNEKQIIFEIKNTCFPENETHTRSKGFGGLITSNIIKAFGELKKSISSDGQQFSLKVIIQKR